MADITSNLVGLGAFDENTGTNAADSGSGGNAGTLTNGATWTAPGKIGASCLSLDGSDDYVSIGDPVNLRPGTNNFSVAAWFKTTRTVRAFIFSSYAGVPDFIYLNIGDVAAGRVLFAWRDQSTTNPVSSPATYNDDAWHHACGVSVANDAIYLYIDGAQVAFTGQGAVTPNIATNAQNWCIGGLNGSSETWLGNIDMYVSTIAPLLQLMLLRYFSIRRRVTLRGLRS